MATNFVGSFGMPPGRPDDIEIDGKGAAARDSDEGTTHSDDSNASTTRDKAKMSDAEVVSQIERYRNEAFMREYIIRNNWLDCYGQYRNKQDFDDKAPWQSRITFAKAHSAIKSSFSLSTRSISCDKLAAPGLSAKCSHWISLKPLPGLASCIGASIHL